MKKWIQAFRLQTLPLAVSTIIAGCSLAIFIQKDNSITESRSSSTTDLLIFGLAVLTAILLQVLSNLANDYGDFKKGTDNEDRIGPKRAMQSGAISEPEMKKALIINALLAFISGSTLLYITFEDQLYQMLIYLLIGIAAIVAAIKYTLGKNPYGYRALGDLFVFLFFGVVGVLGSYYLIRFEITPEAVMAAIGMGAFSVMVLNLNNMRDVVNDEANNKITIPVKIGLETARTTYHPFLILLGWSSFIALFLYLDLDSMIVIFLPAIVFVKHLRFVIQNEDPIKFNPELKKIALGTFGVSLAIFIGSILFYNFF